MAQGASLSRAYTSGEGAYDSLNESMNSNSTRRAGQYSHVVKRHGSGDAGADAVLIDIDISV